jgi:hypothetical protein
MDMPPPSSPFSAGPRLADAPRGDPRTEAIASLRGYAYQLYASALAWLDLRPGHELYLEVAKDYAVAAADALNAVEVKDTGSSSVTINSKDIRDTLDAFVDLVERNPTRDVHLRFLSTSPIGQERKHAHRVAGKPALLYWRQAAAGADLPPLRDVLSRAELSPRVRAFIDARDDEALRKDFLRRIHWDCGRPDLDAITAELQGGLVRYGAERLRTPPAKSRELVAVVLHHVLTTALQGWPRRLIDTDLLALLSDATRISVSQADLDTLMHRLASELPATQRDAPPLLAAALPQVLELERDIPLPAIRAERPALVGHLLLKTRQHGIAFVTGGTGRGKTLLCRLAARSHGGGWHLLDLRDAEAPETVQRLELALGSLATSNLPGMIVNDLNHIEDPALRRALSRLVLALRRRDALCVVTAYREPSARALSELGIDRAAHLAIPDLTEDEVGDMIAAAGADRKIWAKPVWMAGGFGHPQLVQAIISGLRLRSWPRSELAQLRAFKPSDDVESERRATRQHLIATVPYAAKALLYRISLLLGRFDRPLALTLGALAPPISDPGEQLDILIGPWVDRASPNHFRISPLLSNAGAETLAPDQQIAVHRLAAETLTAGRRINVSNADPALLHALLGKSDTALLKLSYGIVKADQADRERLVEWITGLRLHRTDRPIYPDKPGLSRLLRFAQFLLVAQKGDPDNTRACWSVLQTETRQESDPEITQQLEYMVLAKVLTDQSSAGMLPGWIDLILRYHELSTVSAERRRLLARMTRPIDGRPAPTVFGMQFIIQVMGLQTVADLKATFDRLDALSPEQRQLLLADALKIPGDFTLIVSHAWVEQSRRGTLDWRASAELYRNMAVQAQTWGYRDLAMRCHVARGVMLDEYGNDAEAAQHALDNAATALGDDPVLTRARARILRDQRGGAQPMGGSSSMV